MNALLQGQAIGRTFTLAVGAFRAEVTVVGVVGGATKNSDDSPAVYYPAPLIYQPAQTLYLRLDQTGQFNAAALHAAVREVDPRVPLADVATLAEIRLRSYSDIILLTRAVAILGVLALVLAAGGLYSAHTGRTVRLCRRVVRRRRRSAFAWIMSEGWLAALDDFRNWLVREAA